MIEKKSTLLYPACKVERRAPVNLGGGDSGFSKKINFNFNAVPLFTFANVNVTPEGHVFKKMTIDKDLLIYPAHKKTYNRMYLLSTIIKRKRIVLPAGERYLLCHDYWSNSVFHWMCDVMPRIEAVKDLARECVLILPSFYEYSYIHETLKAFKFRGIYLLDDSSYVNCRELVVPGHITVSGQMRPENIRSMRSTLLDHFQPPSNGKFNYPNIYVSRVKAKYRKVINEAEIIPILKRYHFEVICFEDHSIAEQVEMCYNANNIVSIHGANLTNVIFMQENKNVLELRKKGDEDNNYFYELADSVNCNYYHLDCDFEDPVPNKNFFSLHVNPEQFELCLARLLNLK
jgi:hypothetical protein